MKVYWLAPHIEGEPKRANMAEPQGRFLGERQWTDGKWYPMWTVYYKWGSVRGEHVDEKRACWEFLLNLKQWYKEHGIPGFYIGQEPRYETPQPYASLHRKERPGSVQAAGGGDGAEEDQDLSLEKEAN